MGPFRQIAWGVLLFGFEPRCSLCFQVLGFCALRCFCPLIRLVPFLCDLTSGAWVLCCSCLFRLAAVAFRPWFRAALAPCVRALVSCCSVQAPPLYLCGDLPSSLPWRSALTHLTLWFLCRTHSYGIGLCGRHGCHFISQWPCISACHAHVVDFSAVTARRRGTGLVTFLRMARAWRFVWLVTCPFQIRYRNLLRARLENLMFAQQSGLLPVPGWWRCAPRKGALMMSCWNTLWRCLRNRQAWKICRLIGILPAWELWSMTFATTILSCHRSKSRHMLLVNKLFWEASRRPVWTGKPVQ